MYLNTCCAPVLHYLTLSSHCGFSHNAEALIVCFTGWAFQRVRPGFDDFPPQSLHKRRPWRSLSCYCILLIPTKTGLILCQMLSFCEPNTSRCSMNIPQCSGGVPLPNTSMSTPRITQFNLYFLVSTSCFPSCGLSELVPWETEMLHIRLCTVM